MKSIDLLHSDVDVEASEVFVQRLQGEWTPTDQAQLEARLESDRTFADAYSRVEMSWAGLDKHAETPEFMRYREEAMAYARRASAHRWLKPSPNMRSRWRGGAIAASIAVSIGIAWQLSPFAYVSGQYRTGIGEQRMVELDDHSRIALDATTRLQVRFSKDARVVVLKGGQAQFSVAHDPARPFKVIAGDRTIIAVGTVFTVEFTNQVIHVAMMEGKVAIVSDVPSPAGPLQPSGNLAVKSMVEESHGKLSVPNTNGSPANLSDSDSHAVGGPERASTIELSAGEELRANEGGPATVTPRADLEAATAWREGKLIFRTEQLVDAVRRVNRYSRVQIEIDDEALASRRISGVFETGDTQGFVNAVERYLPVSVDRSNPDTIKLSIKFR